MENHDEAYYLWREQGVRNTTLVHVDAHHDMWPANDGPVNVGNYVSRAIRDGIVGDIYWVVPDASFSSRSNADFLLRNLERLPKVEGLRILDKQITARYDGHNVSVCCARDLPQIDGPVLLDVDVDYFVLPIVSSPEVAEVPEQTPWTWPEDLVNQLVTVQSVSLLTIACSVNGGTTPIRWKHLGEEFRDHFAGCEPSRYFKLIRDASNAHGEIKLRLLREAVSLRPEHPAAHWHLSEALESAGLLDDAHKSYRAAIACDASYSTIYNTAGPCLEAAERLDDATAEYRRRLLVDEDDPFALFGCGSVAAAKGEWTSVREFLQHAIARGCNIPDAHRLLGDSFRALNEKANALRAYESFSVQLVAGQRSMCTPISTRESMDDVYEVEVRAQMAELYRELGNNSRAEEEYRWLSDKYVPNTTIASIRARHASLLFSQGNATGALAGLGSAALGVPLDAVRASRKAARLLATTTSAETPVRNALLNVARSAVSLLCAVATSVILARTLGPQAMGLYGYTLWIAGVMVAFCHFGLPTALTRFVAERAAVNDRQGMAQAAKNILLVQLAIIVCVMALGALVLFIGGANKEVPWVFAVLLVAPMALQQSFTAALMGTHDYGRLAVVGLVGGVVQVLLVAGAAWLDGSLKGFLIAMVVANIVNAALYAWPIRSARLLTAHRDVTARSGFDWRPLFRFAAPVAYLVMLDMVVWQRSETFFLGRYSTWAEIGFYSIAYLMISRLNDALVAATSTLLPLQASRMSAHGEAAVAETQWRSFRVLQMLLIPACACAAVLSRPAIILLYGEEYLRVWPVLLVLLASPLAVSMTDVSVASLYAMDKQKSLVVPLTCTAVFNIVLAYLLVPRFGALGAASANSAAQIAEGMFLLLFSASVLASSPPWRQLSQIYIAGVVAFAPASIAEWFTLPSIAIAFLALAGSVAYFAILLRMNGLSLRQWRELATLIAAREHVA